MKLSSKSRPEASAFDHDPLWICFRRLNTEKLGVRHDRLQRKETVSTADVKRMMCSMGPDPIDEDEIDQFLADIGFADDKFVKITDFAKFLME